MHGLLAVAGFAAVLVVVSRVLKRSDAAGDFDPQSPSTAARPGLRLFFDFSNEGWRGDGINQRPPPPEQYD